MPDESTEIWTRLRQLRWSLQQGPLLKDSSSRRNALSAAMTQFEEQMTAANVVTHATRPINLYYALTQAGLAVSAVHTPGTYSFSSHGLKIVNPEADLPDIVVKADTDMLRGGYQIVSAAVGSEIIESGVSVLALWSTLPELTEIIEFPGSKHPEPLPLHPDGPFIWHSPGASDTEIKPPVASIFVYDPPAAAQVTDEWLTELLKHYAGTTGCRLHQPPDELEPEHARMQISVEWPSSDPARNLTKQETADLFDKIAPQYRYRTDRFLRPSIEPNGKNPPSPLMAWWLLLYVFSMLARYQPVKWVKLLDLDKSQYAAVLQYTLQEALSSLPHLAVEALSDRPYLNFKPMVITG